MNRSVLAIVFAGLLGQSSSVSATTANFAAPVLDKWMYGNVDGTTGGQIDVAPVFAFLNSTDEDRMGSLLVAFDTATLVPANLGLGAYAVTSVKLTLTVRTPDTFLYDPTHDAFRTYLQSSDPLFQADADTGRPVEIFGVGLRNGYTQLKGSISGGANPYLETSPFGTSGQPSFRNAFPLGVSTSGALYDVADNVGQQQEAIPFAVGTAALAAGASVPEGTEFTFELQLSDAAILSYVQEGLNGGVLGLYVSSLHSAAGQGGPQTYPRFLTREGADFLGEAAYAPQLEITYTLVPEPSATLSLLLGVGLITAGRAFHRRRYFQ